MGGEKKFLGLVFSLVMICSFLVGEAYSQKYNYPPGYYKRKYKNRVRRAVKTYNYVENHDLNNDGKVNTKDRLIWLKSLDKDTVYVSKENEDITEVMDLDEDGDVEEWEAKVFYDQYDLNENGILEDEEIEAAVD